MATLRKLYLAWITMLNAGCVIVLGDGTGSGASGESGNGKASALPEPEDNRVDPPALTAEQQKKKAEADAYTASFIYQGRPIAKTVQGDSGTIYDYMTIPPLDIQVPDVLSLLPGAPPDGIQLGLTEVEKYSDLWGPDGTTVFVRPDFSKYIMEDTGATSIQDWVDNYQVPGLPDAAYRLYAGINIPVANRGIFARINAFKPDVAKNSFSLIELAVRCPTEGDAEEFLGVLLSVDRVNREADGYTPTPPELRLHVEYRQMVNGKLEGSYDHTGGHFYAEDGRPADVGAPISLFSVPGGEQWEHALMLIMDPFGDWLVSYNYQYIGRFRADGLKTLQNGACAAQVYAEVYNPHPELGWVATEMGSGQFSSAPSGYVAWAREIRYFDTNWWPAEPPSDDFVHWSKPYDPVCYDRQPLASQGSAGPIMKFGGPGGKNSVCAQKKPVP